MAFKFGNLKVWEKVVDLSSEISFLVKAFLKVKLYVLIKEVFKINSLMEFKVSVVTVGR